jgi:hypothetical protein
VDDRLLRLLRRQHASGFADLRGADVAITVPVSERLLNDAVAEWLPSSAPVRDLHIQPLAGDRFTVRLRIGSSPLFPPIKLSLSIDQQPSFPDSPVLVLRLQSSGLLSLAGPALRFLNALPDGIRADHDRIYIDIPRLLEIRGLAHYLEYVETLTLHTEEGSVVVSIRGSIKRSAP